MAAYECVGCANEFDLPKPPRECPECGSRHLISQAPERERDADDGRSYGHPGDELADRRERLLAED